MQKKLVIMDLGPKKKICYNKIMKVILLSYTKDIEKLTASAISQCYSEKSSATTIKTIKKETQKKLIKKVIESGHHSTIEHASFTFSIEGVSRSLTHELVRHRIASFSHQSQRYVKIKNGNFDYIIPPEINKNKELKKDFENKIKEIGNLYNKFIQNKIKPEDARFILPNAIETKITTTMNCRALLNFFELRCCTRAQWEIRNLANKMLKLCKEKAPTIFENAGPSCISKKICFEKDFSCGLWKKIDGAILK